MKWWWTHAHRSYREEEEEEEKTYRKRSVHPEQMFREMNLIKWKERSSHHWSLTQTDHFPGKRIDILASIFISLDWWETEQSFHSWAFGQLEKESKQYPIISYSLGWFNRKCEKKIWLLKDFVVNLSLGHWELNRYSNEITHIFRFKVQPWHIC